MRRDGSPGDGVLHVPGPGGLSERIRDAAARMRMDYALVVLDVVLALVSYGTALLLRLDGVVGEPYDAQGVRFLAAAAAAHVAMNGLSGLYGNVWQQASVEEARRVVVAGVGAFIILVAWVFAVPGQHQSLSVVVVGGSVCLLLTGVLRFRSRLFAFHLGTSRPRLVGRPARVIVIGAGSAARSVITEMRSDRNGEFEPVAVIDGASTNQGRTLVGVPVLGGLGALPDVAAGFGAEIALLADPEADRRTVESTVDAAQAAGLEVRILPHVSELMGRPATVRDARGLSISDLLGRQQVPTDLESIRGILAGRRVLISGGGGSIGSELARQIHACDPTQLILLDHDDSHLHDAAADIGGDVVQVLADIRDGTRIRGVFARHRPEIVFHAAAQKHVPILEGYPCEAVATNVAGTVHLLNAARSSGVERFIFISTDKAVSPRSVMGATKRLGEQLVLDVAPPGSRFCAVRFGNVLGSRGSVIPTFTRQIQNGGPVTVTHLDMTRYFMTIPEAVQLVLQAAALSRGGEVFMLDMGDPVHIVDLARRMITLSGRRPDVDVQLRFTGLRPGEKLSEELTSPGEAFHPTSHASINAIIPPRLSSRRLRDGVARLVELAQEHSEDPVCQLLFALATEAEQPDPSGTVVAEVIEVPELATAPADGQPSDVRAASP